MRGHFLVSSRQANGLFTPIRCRFSSKAYNWYWYIPLVPGALPHKILAVGGVR